MSGRLDRVLRIVQDAKSVSMGDIESRSGLSRPAVAAVIKQLKAENRVYMGGERRFARYATTQAAADRASADARGA
jgi:predicted transcriptional regulator